LPKVKGQNIEKRCISHSISTTLFTVVLVWYLFFLTTISFCQEDFFEMSLEELMALEVSSAAKRLQPFSETAAAIFVITQEDIRRSGAVTIPEILAMAPGVEVEPVNAWSWAVSIRGSNSRYSNKLLVLIDGRSIYSPIFSGVFWDNHNLLLDDIERIEVIRGPGSSLWGANAVNGIINIITKRAKDTQGGFAKISYGYPWRTRLGIRYGDAIGSNFFYRVYYHYVDHEEAKTTRGSPAGDAWYDNRLGFRLDWGVRDKEQIILSGDWNFGKRSWRHRVPAGVPPYYMILEEKIYKSPWNLYFKWNHTLDNTGELSLKAYWDHDQFPGKVIDYKVDTADVEFQLRTPLSDDQLLTLGIGYRHSKIVWPGNRFAQLRLSKRDIDYMSAFFQYEIFFWEDKLALICGSKFEHNPFTDFEMEPNVRIRYSPSKNHTFWSAVSRAVRTPDISTYNTRILLKVAPPSPPFLPYPSALIVNGNPHYDAESVWAFEAGYRSIINNSISFDTAIFFNKYYNLLASQPLGPPYFRAKILPHFEWEYTAVNKMYGETYGLELDAKVDLTPWWRLQLAYSYIKLFLHLRHGATEYLKDSEIENNSPRHQFSIRSSMDLVHNIQFDCWFKYVDRLLAQSNPSYLTMNLRLAWRPIKKLELSLAGQNILGHHRKGFFSDYFHEERTRVDQAFYVAVKWEF